MLLNFPDLIKKHSLKITGIIQVGCHHCQEVPTYHAHGILKLVLIEPCAAAFKIAQLKYGNDPDITLLNFACGSYTGEASMFIETANAGQSNSLLKPVNHLKHYPDIKFKDTELVQVRPLDDLPLPAGINTLVMDVQGGEGHVLLGGRQVLAGMDYVYTEVNADNGNLYEGATGITELDAILYEFERVETSWTKQGWGDSLYIRKTLFK